MRYEIDIFHYLNIYKKEWKKMAALILLTMLITMIVTLLQPIMYRSTISVLSPKEGGGMGNLGSYLGLSMGPSSDDIIFSMLKSRRMSNDINEHFNLRNKRRFWWEIDTYIVTGGFAVEVKGSDPELTRDIANFSIANLDKINSELQITTQKPMVKVLDPALRGAPVAKKVSNRVAASGLFTLLLHAFFLFFKDYFSQLKKASR